MRNEIASRLLHIALVLGVALIAACDAKLEQGPTDVDMETFAAKVKSAGSPQAACQELGQLCNGQNLGCTAFEHFCGDLFAQACDRLKEACGFFPQACDLHAQYCAGNNAGQPGDPNQPGDPSQPPGPNAGCCDLIQSCVSTQQGCDQAVQVCANELGFSGQNLPIDPSQIDPAQLQGLIGQICPNLVPTAPSPTTPPGVSPSAECCAAAQACMQDQTLCPQAIQVCAPGMNLPPNMPIPDPSQLQSLIDAVCGSPNNGTPSPQPQPGGQVLSAECCAAFGECLQDQAKCLQAAQVCAQSLNIGQLPGSFPVDWTMLQSLYSSFCGGQP